MHTLDRPPSMLPPSASLAQALFPVGFLATEEPAWTVLTHALGLFLFLRTEAVGASCVLCVLCSLPCLFLLSISSCLCAQHTGRQASLECPPDSEPQQVPRPYAASMGFPWEGKHDQPPTGCVCRPHFPPTSPLVSGFLLLHPPSCDMLR